MSLSGVVPLVFGVDVRAVVEKHLHDGDAVVAGSEVEGSAVPAVQVTHVHEARLGRQDRPYALHVPSTCRLQASKLVLQHVPPTGTRVSGPACTACRR